jgi:hypothetical protein
MSVVNFIPTRDGKKASAVCEFCDRRSRPVAVDSAGEPDLWALPVGWSQAPFRVDFAHDDGSTGSLWACPVCNRRLDHGKGRGSVHADRRAAIAARRTDRLSVQIRG